MPRRVHSENVPVLKLNLAESSLTRTPAQECGARADAYNRAGRGTIFLTFPLFFFYIIFEEQTNMGATVRWSLPPMYIRNSRGVNTALPVSGDNRISDEGGSMAIERVGHQISHLLDETETGRLLFNICIL
ncbi:hypothetical protein EVAR_100279_1 [Eumeta japonica]|uniref:Uncharacterized protein n=1 Tax=Eumeta variegata TaxID=151549 RepID=A0A4C1TAL7_EUMVA|nr:hypothetical protein EVAR_100279_1 [Eumeta japonica]